MTGGELDNCLPPELIDSSSWPWWSRVFGRPPKAIQHLRAEWGKLRALSARESVLPLLGAHGSKIFGNSVCCWDALDHYGMETFSFHEPHLHVRRPIPAENRFVSPYGRLVIETRIEAYECDASAIEGIWASKSSEESFASVDEFGENFCRYKGWGLDMASLKLACRHDQVRIFNSPGIDVFEARAWDGRFGLLPVSKTLC